MDRSEAAAHLGVDEHAGPDEVRRAFRRLLLRHHPDVAGGDGTAARTLTEAYRTLAAAPDATTEPVVTTATDDTVSLALPSDEAFLRLLDAAAHLGEVTYVDDHAGLLEVLVTFDDGRTASVVVSLQGRADGTTDAFCTLEPLDLQRPAPPLGAVIDALVAHLG